MVFKFDVANAVDSLDTVPVEFQGAYLKGADGKFTVNPVLKGLAEAYNGVSNGLESERKAKKTANEESASRRLALKKFEDLAKGAGIAIDDGADVADLLTAHITELANKSASGQEMKINLDKVTAGYKKEIENIKKAGDLAVVEMQTSLERYLIGDAANAALASANVVSPTLLLPHVKSQVKVVKNGNDFVAAVVDAEGNARMNSKGAPMSVADLVAEMKTKPEFMPAFKSEVKSGSGMDSRSGVKTTVRTGDKVELSPKNKIAAGLADRAK